MPTLSAQIQSALDTFATAWNTNDGAALANLFVEDSALVNPFGQRADGRAAVAAMYTEYFGGLLHGTTTEFKLGNVRTIDDMHAFVDKEEQVLAADHSVVLQLHLAALMRRDGDGWRFVDGLR